MTYMIPEPEDFRAGRADMTFGMRRAARYYNELVAPGISGASMTRHFTWCVLGLKLAQTLGEQSGGPGLPNERVARGVEALANKLEHAVNPTASVRGSRAFARHPDVWDFARLSRRQYYVLITNRQYTTRALPEGSGLGFTTGSGRFNAMELTGAGHELAGVADQKVWRNSPLSSILQQWANGTCDINAKWTGLQKALSVSSPTAGERDLVFRQLDSVITSGDFAKHDPMRRHRLILALNRDPDRQWGGMEEFLNVLREEDGGSTHARDILAAQAFEAMRFAGAFLVITMANLLGPAGTSRTTVEEMAEHPSLKASLKELSDRILLYRSTVDDGGQPHPQADLFIRKTATGGESAIRTLLENDGRILVLEGDEIYRGPLFRADMGAIDALDAGEVDDDADDTGSDDEPAGASDFHPRLGQFMRLWRDCHA